SAQRYVRQRGYRAEQMLRRLRHDAVVDARFRIEPEVGLQQHGAGERGEHTRGDLLLRDAEFERLVAIDVHAEGRIVLRLGYSEIADAGDQLHPILKAQCDVVVGLEVVAVDLRVDSRGQAEIEDLADDVGGLKVGGDVWILAFEQVANLTLVDGGGLM